MPQPRLEIGKECLEKLGHEVMHTAITNLLKDGCVEQIYFNILDIDAMGKLHIVPMIIPGVDRETALTIMKLTVQTGKIKAFGFVTEAWGATPGIDEDPNDLICPIREREDKFELILVNFQSKKGQFTISTKFSRTELGTPCNVTPHYQDWISGELPEEQAGRMQNLF